MDLGLELKIERIRAGLKQYEIAAALNVTPQFVSLVELGRKRPPAGFVERFLEALARCRRSSPPSDHADDPGGTPAVAER